MRRAFYILILFALTSFSLPDRPEDGWLTLSKVKFTEKFFKEHNEYYLYPLFDSRIRALEGKDFILKGHYLPMDLENRQMIIISRYPFSMCLFCGGAGPESVAEVHFAARPPRFKADQIITVKGKLKLNDANVDHMNFILENAMLIPHP
jgi:hypothetical protein